MRGLLLLSDFKMASFEQLTNLIIKAEKCSILYINCKRKETVLGWIPDGDKVVFVFVFLIDY